MGKTQLLISQKIESDVYKEMFPTTLYHRTILSNSDCDSMLYIECSKVLT